ncbi:hypothetical protein BSL78_19485 [Apostichopus japonicus]|uniref:Uncharacterized protein n=1 Tax=Stichopus japonicus TaxID=307972 RepID=A0A2G8K6L4_STIJA|nr:hypothetical protein BSL78_19485 [Apostichopus japonicus]
MAIGITDGSKMVKVTLRKSTKHLTPVEKLLSLERNRDRNRNRVHFLNRRENKQLAKRYHGYEQKSSNRMRDILRTKDQMKLDLIELDYSRRKAKTICEFEKRLREGKGNPVFLKEHLKLVQKEEELAILLDRLNGPNSQMVASHIREELRAINHRVDHSSSSYRIEPNFVNSIEQSQSRTIDKNEVHGTETIEIEGATHELLKPVHSEPESESKRIEGAVAENEQGYPEQFGLQCDEINNEEHINRETKLADILEKVEELPRDAVIGQIPFLSRSDSIFPITSSVSQRRNELPPLKVKTRQKHCHFVVHRSHRPRQSTLNPTRSAQKRAKHAQKRVTELTEKTRLDMKKDETMRRRKEVDTPRDSLKGIQQAETIARLEVAKKGITLPDIKTANSQQQTPRARTVDISIKLPSLKVDRELLSELKRQRYKHKNQSESFPQLPK